MINGKQSYVADHWFRYKQLHTFWLCWSGMLGFENSHIQCMSNLGESACRRKKNQNRETRIYCLFMGLWIDLVSNWVQNTHVTMSKIYMFDKLYQIENVNMTCQSLLVKDKSREKTIISSRIAMSDVFFTDIEPHI